MDDWVQWAFGVIFAVQLSMFGWFMKLLSGKANKESTDKRFDRVMAELKTQRDDMKDHILEDRDMHGEVLHELRTVNTNLATTNANLANLTGRFEASEGR